MRNTIICAFILCGLILTFPVSATSIKPVELSGLYQEADVVAYLQVLAGDSEAYDDGGLVKAKVLTAFKGCVDGQVLFFSPASYETRDEYLVFLEDTHSSIISHRKCARGADCADLFDSNENVFTSMYAGYSVMLVGYSNDLGDWDNVVAFAERQIILPPHFKSATVDDWNRATDKVLVSKKSVTEYLNTLKEKVK